MGPSLVISRRFLSRLWQGSAAARSASGDGRIRALLTLALTGKEGSNAGIQSARPRADDRTTS